MQQRGKLANRSRHDVYAAAVLDQLPEPALLPGLDYPLGEHETQGYRRGPAPESIRPGRHRLLRLEG